MMFQDAIKTCFKKYADFSGRAMRSEYWWFALFSMITSFILLMIDPSETLYLIFSLAVLLPSLAVGARRLHDIDRSGWWLLLSLVPLVGIIVLIVWFCTKGTPGTNRFGPENVIDVA